MATRCNVIIKEGNKQTILYRHWDGYPEITGKELKELIHQAKAGKYTTGWVLSELKKIMRRDYKGREIRQYEDTDSIHGDIAYLYTIMPDLRLKIKKVGFSGSMDMLKD